MYVNTYIIHVYYKCSVIYTAYVTMMTTKVMLSVN